MSGDYLIPDDMTGWTGRDSKGPPRGGNSRAASLTVEHVREIKRRLNAGEAATKIAADFPVTAKQIGRIKRRESWSHVHVD